jgi:hypothetical protein
METNEHCVLWESAKAKARDRGLIMTDTCPLDNFCDGPNCPIIESPKQKDKRETAEKLAALRNELKRIR